MAETISVNGETIEITQDNIMGMIDQYRGYDSFTYEENQEYQALVNVALQNDYIPSTEKNTYLSYTPVGGKEGEITRAFPEPIDYLKAHPDDPNVYDVIVNNYTREDVLFMMESGGLDSETTKMLNGMVSSKYSSLDIEFAQKSMGDFHYSGDSLINVIVDSVDCDSKIRTAYTSLTTLKAENSTSDGILGMGNMDDAIVANLPEHLQNKYIYIGSVMDVLNTDIATVSDNLKTICDASERYNDEIEKVAKVIANFDADFANKLKSSIEDYTMSKFRALQSGEVSFDAAQFYETVHRYLNSDISNLDLTGKEKKFLEELIEIGKNESNYYHSDNFEKFLMNAAAVPFWVAEGFIDKAEGIVDGGITIIGGCVSNSLYAGSLITGSLADLTGSDDLSSLSDMLKYGEEGATHLTRTVIGYDFSHETMSGIATTVGVNEYVYETSDVAKPAKAVGAILFDVALNAAGLPEPVMKGIEFAQAVNGEEYAQNETLTDEQFMSAARANMYKVALFDYVAPDMLKAIKPRGLRGEVGKTALTLGVDVGEFLVDEAIDYNVKSAQAYNEEGVVPTFGGYARQISKADKIIPLQIGLLDKAVSSVADYGKYDEEHAIEDLVKEGYSKEVARDMYKSSNPVTLADSKVVKGAKFYNEVNSSYNANAKGFNNIGKYVKTFTGYEIPSIDSKSLRVKTIKGGMVIYDDLYSAQAETVETGETVVSEVQEIKPSTDLNDYNFRGGVLTRKTE